MKRQAEPENPTMVWRRLFARHAACFKLSLSATGVALSLAEVEHVTDWKSGTWTGTDETLAAQIGRTTKQVRRAREALLAAGWWTRPVKGGKRWDDSVGSSFSLVAPAVCPMHGALPTTALSGQLSEPHTTARHGQLSEPSNDHSNAHTTARHGQRSTSESEAERTSSSSSSSQTSRAEQSAAATTAEVGSVTRVEEEGFSRGRDDDEGVSEAAASVVVESTTEERRDRAGSGATPSDVMAMAGFPAARLRDYYDDITDEDAPRVRDPGLVLKARIDKLGPDLVATELREWIEPVLREAAKRAELAAVEARYGPVLNQYMTLTAWGRPRRECDQARVTAVGEALEHGVTWEDIQDALLALDKSVPPAEQPTLTEVLAELVEQMAEPVEEDTPLPESGKADELEAQMAEWYAGLARIGLAAAEGDF